MKRLRLFYNIKLYFIVILAIIFFGSVEAAPEQPLLFGMLTVIFCCCIRFLWRSLLKDEQKMKSKRVRLNLKKKPLVKDTKSIEHAA